MIILLIVVGKCEHITKKEMNRFYESFY